MLEKLKNKNNHYTFLKPPSYDFKTLVHFMKHFFDRKTDSFAEFYNFLTAPASTILDQWFGKEISFIHHQ